MQQYVVCKVGEVDQRLALNQVRAGDGDHSLLHQPCHFQARIAARAIADSDVDLAGAEVYQFHSSRDPDVNHRVQAFEPAQSRHQPLGGERGRHGHCQPPPIHGGGEHGGGLGQTIERLAQGRQGDLRGVGEQQPLGRAFEEGHADEVFQVLDLLADRARGHRQLVRRAAEVQMPGRRFERAQGVQGRQSVPLFHQFS